MLRYIVRRLLYMIVLLFLVSVTAFTIIQLPPGDYVDSLIAELRLFTSTELTQEDIHALRQAYGVDRPVYVQYLKWIGKLLRGDFGISLHYRRPVVEMLKERVPLTIIISLITMAFTYIIAVPIGIYSATHQYSAGDYAATTLGFIGLATPNFLLAIILMFFLHKFFDFTSIGLFSSDYLNAPWSLAKFLDMLKHLPLPIIVVGTAGTAGLIRILRGCLLDELRKQYVVTARTKGVSEGKILFKYPVRLAINPLVSTFGWNLAGIVSGATITSIVLNLPTTGPLLFEALQKQDMELAGSIIMLLSFLTVVGTVISDILLVIVDPRIRYEKTE